MNNDVCIHVRLTDAAQHNPGASYYIQTLARIKPDNIFIEALIIIHLGSILTY